MRVLFKQNQKTETIENVSVDDKCLPVVNGKQPYSPSAKDPSPLAHQSALWFKTLAVDSIYIDCDRRLIFWTPVVNDIDSGGVVLRKSLSNDSKNTTSSGFIPPGARPLFEDSTLYDFDANLKEMMGKCCEAAKKYFKKSLSVDEFGQQVAKLLHVYILPSINFLPDDMYSLSRTRCLIEERLGKAEDSIAHKADSVDQLKKCQITLKTNLLSRENMDSERYLRTCRKDFIEVFLKTIEADVEDLNFQLTAEQSKVNWAKSHSEDFDKVQALQEKRNELFKEVEKLIKVREALKNVSKRKDLTKRKVRKSQIIESCFHNVYVEVNRRLELEYQALNRLGNDKVNICAAREATMCAILEMDNNNRNSDRATKFEPEDFGDYTLSETNPTEKSGVWLTFQERVSKVLNDTTSRTHILHETGCANLSAYISYAFSEFKLAEDGHHRYHRKNDMKSEIYNKPANDISFRKLTIMLGQADESVGLDKEENNTATSASTTSIPEAISKNQMHNTLGPVHFQHETPLSSGYVRDRRALSSNDIFVDVDNQFNPFHFSKPAGDDGEWSNSLLSQTASYKRNEFEDDGYVVLRHPEKAWNTQQTKSQQVMTQQLALSSLMNCVDNLKALIQTHFREITEVLLQELKTEEHDDVASIEMPELLWKSYEQTFCKVLLPQLLQLYSAGLTPGATKAHATLSRTSLAEILKDDKLLDLFFGQGMNRQTTQSLPIPLPTSKSSDKISMAKTLSTLSMDVRHCNINDLYNLANADSNDLRKRFNLDEMDDPEDSGGIKVSSSGSESADLSNDEGAADLNAESVSTSNKSLEPDTYSDADSASEADRDSTFQHEDGLDVWNNLSNPSKVEEILDPVLSPFRKQVRKCLDANCFLDKVRYITKGIEGLNSSISQMIGPDFQSACDDIISMLILALSNLSEDVFVGLYVNLRLLMDIQPTFLSGTLWDYNLVSLYASYDYLFTLKVCENVVKRFPGSFKVRAGR